MMLGLVVGAVIGAALFYWFSNMDEGTDSSKVKALEAEHEIYRKKVDDHFVNTAVLFKGLTEQYRDVYRHIASGAGDLCSEEAKAIQIDLEETALLAQPPVEVEVTEPVDNVNVVDANEAEPEAVETKCESAECETTEIETTVEEKAAEKETIADDDIPLASEVEIPQDVAKEAKIQSAEKNN